jgi:proteic killer suppression protein
MIFRVEISRLAEKQLRKVPGYHDEPLKGERSIRLTRAYRAIYEIKQDTARFVSVEEVSKHEY